MAAGMRRPAKELALRLVGRKVAKRLGYEDEAAMGDTAIRLYNKGSCRGLDNWKDVAVRIEQLLEQAVKDGTVRRSTRMRIEKAAPVGSEGWHQPRYQDDDGFHRRR